MCALGMAERFPGVVDGPFGGGFLLPEVPHFPVGLFGLPAILLSLVKP